MISANAAQLFDADIVSVVMINPRTQDTVKTVMRTPKAGETKGWQVLQTNVTGWMMVNNAPFFSEDIRRDARFAADVFDNSIFGSIIGEPMRFGGSLSGFLLVGKFAENTPFPRTAAEQLRRFVLLVSPHLGNTQKIQAFFQPGLPETALLERYAAAGLLGKSPAFLELLHAVEAAAKCDVRVLLEGKSGTGKERIARAIHRFSERREWPFVAIDCGAIPENLLESELFGHVKGAFTGATTDRKGLMESANGGTLFMDEIGNLPLTMQAKLMRVLQENEIRPLGSNQTRNIDVRIIAAASRSLRERVNTGEFREDLFYRLFVYPIPVPTLAERSGDIPELAHHFLQKFAAQQGKQAEQFSPQLIKFIKNRTWPGNIRELENFVERLVAFATAETKMVSEDAFPADLRAEFSEFQKSSGASASAKPLKDRLQECEEKILREALADHDWNQSQAARALGISEQVMRYRMKKLGIAKRR